MSDCPTSRLLEQYYHGDLRGADRQAIEEHVAGCQRCANTVVAEGRDSELEKQLRLLRNATTTQDPTGESPADADVLQDIRIEGYRIIRLIGRGGMGVVYEAEQLKLNRRVALKVLPATTGKIQRDAISRFKREATAAGKLHHTNIVPIYDFGQSGFAYYYAMELIDGSPLNDLIKRFAQINAPEAPLVDLAHAIIPQADGDCLDQGSDSGSRNRSWSGSDSRSRGRAYYQQVALWVADVADALHYAHGQGVVHRDIKPHNLIMSRDGRLMILDFGLAKSSEDRSVTMTGSLIGTLRYMSPEQAMAKRMNVDHRTDIYSLGTTLYELLTFEPAFSGQDEKEVLGQIITREPPSPRKVIPTIPRELDTICVKSMEKNADDRYATAYDLAADLRRFADGIPIVAKPTGLLGRGVKFVRRRRALSAAIFLSILVLVTVPVISYQRSALTNERLNRIHEAYRSARGNKQIEEQFNLLNQWEEIDPEDPSLHETRVSAYIDAYKAEVVAGGSGDSLQTLLRSALSESDRFIDLIGDSITDENRENIAAVYANRCIVFRELGDLDKAVEAGLKAVEIEPNGLRGINNLATAELLRRASRESLVDVAERLRKWIEDSQDQSIRSAIAEHNLAAIYLELGQVDAAYQWLEKAESKKQNESLEWQISLLRSKLLAAVPELSSDPESASAEVTVAANAYEGPELPAVMNRQRALFKAAAKQWELVERFASDAINSDPKDYPSYLLRAIARAKTGNVDKAQEDLEIGMRDPLLDRDSDKSVRVHAFSGFFWFDNRNLLIDLRDQAEAALSAAAQ